MGQRISLRGTGARILRRHSCIRVLFVDGFLQQTEWRVCLLFSISSMYKHEIKIYPRFLRRSYIFFKISAMVEWLLSLSKCRRCSLPRTFLWGCRIACTRTSETKAALKSDFSLRIAPISIRSGTMKQCLNYSISAWLTDKSQNFTTERTENTEKVLKKEKKREK